MANNKKYINAIQISEETHDWLVELANQEGQKTADYIADLLERYFFTKKIPIPIDERANALYELAQRARQRDLARDTVFQMAAAYYLRPTEEGADELAKACDLAEISYEDVWDHVSNDPFATIIVDQKRSGTKQSKCVVWLSEIMTEKEEIDSKVLYEIGKKQGFEVYLIRRAKNVINDNSEGYQIESVHRGSRWQWHLKNYSESNIQNTFSDRDDTANF